MERMDHIGVVRGQEAEARRSIVPWLLLLCAALASPTIASATILLLEARNPEKLARFYENQVGLSVLVRDAGADRIVLAIGDDWLVIAPGGEGEPRGAPRILPQGSTISHRTSSR